MSDIMRQVVQEVLHGEKTKTIVSARATNETRKPKTNPALDHIKRPNYQQLKKEQRLSFVDRKATVKTADRENSTGRSKSKTNATANQFNEQSFSTLNSLSLVQGNVPKKSNAKRHGKMDRKKASRIIGKTKDGGCVWFFPNLPKDLIGNFQRPLNYTSVGVVNMPKCLPSHLLLINEIIRTNQDIKFHLAWNKDGETPFTVELYDDNEERLDKIMHDIFQRLNRRAMKPYETYSAMSPSPWLSKQLNIGAAIDAIAFLEGIPYYTSIVLMDTVLRNFEPSDFTYEIKSNYVLLKGNYHVISKLVAELKKEASRII